MVLTDFAVSFQKKFLKVCIFRKELADLLRNEICLYQCILFYQR